MEKEIKKEFVNSVINEDDIIEFDNLSDFENYLNEKVCDMEEYETSDCPSNERIEEEKEEYKYKILPSGKVLAVYE